MMRLKLFVLGVFLCGQLMGCANNAQSVMEEAQFLLDEAKYTEAIDLLETFVAANPTDFVATAQLAGALFARAYLGDDQTFLGAAAEIFAGNETGSTALQSIAGITPAALDSTSAEADLLRAETLLADTIPADDKTADMFFRQGLTQFALVNLYGVVRINGTAEDVCDIDADAIDADQQEKFNESAAEVEQSFRDGGLVIEELFEQLDELVTALQAAADFEAFVNDQYGVTACP